MDVAKKENLISQVGKDNLRISDKRHRLLEAHPYLSTKMSNNMTKLPKASLSFAPITWTSNNTSTWRFFLSKCYCPKEQSLSQKKSEDILC